MAKMANQLLLLSLLLFLHAASAEETYDFSNYVHGFGKFNYVQLVYQDTVNGAMGLPPENTIDCAVHPVVASRILSIAANRLVLPFVVGKRDSGDVNGQSTEQGSNMPNHGLSYNVEWVFSGIKPDRTEYLKDPLNYIKKAAALLSMTEDRQFMSVCARDSIVNGDSCVSSFFCNSCRGILTPVNDSSKLLNEFGKGVQVVKKGWLDFEIISKFVDADNDLAKQVLEQVATCIVIKGGTNGNCAKFSGNFFTKADCTAATYSGGGELVLTNACEYTPATSKLTSSLWEGETLGKTRGHSGITQYVQRKITDQKVSEIHAATNWNEVRDCEQALYEMFVDQARCSFPTEIELGDGVQIKSGECEDNALRYKSCTLECKPGYVKSSGPEIWWCMVTNNPNKLEAKYQGSRVVCVLENQKCPKPQEDELSDPHAVPGADCPDAGELGSTCKLTCANNYRVKQGTQILGTCSKDAISGQMKYTTPSVVCEDGKF